MNVIFFLVRLLLACENKSEDTLTQYYVPGQSTGIHYSRGSFKRSESGI